MRIARVAFGFFAVGFVAGTVEQAAGVGDAERGHRASAVVPASMDLAVAPVGTAMSPPSRGQPVPLAPIEPDGLAVLLQAPTEAAETAAARARVAGLTDGETSPLATGPRALGTDAAVPFVLGGAAFELQRPMSRLPGPAQSPVPKPQFVSLPPAGPVDAMARGALPQLVQAPRLVRDSTAPEFIMPIDRGRVTSMFNQGRYHPAIDLAAPLGTPVHATTRKQRVTFAGRRGGYGNLVVTRDPVGRQHYYGHLQRIIAGIGALLEQGDLLGLLGSTGHSTGPHVHYEVRSTAGRQFNPAAFLFPGRSVRVGYAWNDPRPASLLAASGSEAVPAAIGTGRAVTRTATHSGARRVVRVSSRRSTRYAARTWRHYGMAMRPRYVTRVAPRYGTRMAARFGQPRPR